MPNSRAKGQRAERQLCAELQDYGYNAKRSQHLYEKGGIDSPDVSGLKGIHIECKHVEKLNVRKALEQSVKDADGKAIPTVFHKVNYSPWLVTLEMHDFMEMYKAWEKQQSGK